MNFVERVLLLRDSSDIKRFTLCCDVLFDTSHVNAWISAAIWRNVQELEINLGNFKEPYSLPHCLFTSVALTKLVLGMPYTLKVPPTTCFSNVKTLGLRGIIFSDDYSTQQLFSGFPVLEFSDENPDESSCSQKGANIDVQFSDESSDVQFSNESSDLLFSDVSSNEGSLERFRQGSVERSRQV
ncbi:F-box/FBD/LRR-repeat protein At5g56420-like, partial [Fagus crenata]